jgi:hypothetical protein
VTVVSVLTVLYQLYLPMKTKFNSQLFGWDISRNEKDFNKFVIAELLYRIHIIEKQNCHCIEHSKELSYYQKELQKWMGK